MSCGIIISRTVTEKWHCSILIWSDEGLWEEERGGRWHVCVERKKKSLLPSYTFSLLLSFVSDLDLPGGLTGRWKRLCRNNKPWEETMGEMESWQRGEGGGEGEIFEVITGQHTCRLGPQISACAHFHHLDGSDLHRTTWKGISYVALPKLCNSFPREEGTLITSWLDLIHRADVSHSEHWFWKMNSFSSKQQNTFSIL